jgi:hypothetical protein
MKVTILFLVSIFFLAACEKQLNEPSASVKNSKISRTPDGNGIYVPFADSVSLAAFNSDKQILKYNLARKMAVMELQSSGFNSTMNWNGSKISTKPVIIYGFDSKPKYYDFIITDPENNVIGTVTVHARRYKSGMLHEVSAGTRNYTDLLSKGTNMKLFANYSGRIYVGILSKAGDTPVTVVDPVTGENAAEQTELSDSAILQLASANLTSTYQQTKQITDTITNDTIKNILVQADTVPIGTQINQLSNSMAIAHQERDAYWNIMNQ